MSMLLRVCALAVLVASAGGCTTSADRSSGGIPYIHRSASY
jgi:hypothetical protein